MVEEADFQRHSDLGEESRLEESDIENRKCYITLHVKYIYYKIFAKYCIKFYIRFISKIRIIIENIKLSLIFQHFCKFLLNPATYCLALRFSYSGQERANI